MATRSADATIRGYYYQFDKTILDILGLQDGHTLYVERIEDIDVETPDEYRAVQCKYIPSKKYSNSTIREPIVLMLVDHAGRQNRGEPSLNYCLYAHYSEMTEEPDPLTLDSLKAVLTYTEDKKRIVFYRDHGLSDELLQSFLANFRFHAGAAFEEQQAAVLKALRTTLSCDEVEADLVFYNNALRVVRDLAICPDADGRKITKAEFLNRVNVKNAIFDRWYLRLRGEDAYRKLARRRIELHRALHPNRDRILFIGRHIIDAPGMVDLPSFIECLVDDYYSYGAALVSDWPLSFIVDLSRDEADALKKELLARQIVFNDGYEDLGFHAWAFNARPVANYQESSRGGITPKLGKASELPP